MKICSYCGKNYPDDHAVCPVDATPLDAVPGLSSSKVEVVTAAQSAQTLPTTAVMPAREAAVTLVVLVVCLGAQTLTLPTLAQATTDQAVTVPSSIVALGVYPLIMGFVLVEIAALLVEPWRRLRTGGPAGRAKLRRGSLITGMILALFQAFVLALFYARIGSSALSPGSFIITVIILLGATAALAVLARIVDEAGLGGGFPMVLLAFLLPEIIGPLRHAYSAVQEGVLASSALQTGGVGLALLVGATLWFFSPYSLPVNGPGEHPALVSRPACGVAPLTFVAAIVTFLIAFLRMMFRTDPGPRLLRLLQFDPVDLLLSNMLPIQLVLSGIAAIAFAYLFNLPDRLAQVWRALSPASPERGPSIKHVMLECVLFVGLAVLVESWLFRAMGDRVPAAVSIILVTGIIADFVREWRARTERARWVPIWEIHQVYAVPPAVHLLQAQGFHPFAKGLRLRSLLQFFGPYAPIVVLVPAEEAQAAYAVLEYRWPVLDGPLRSQGAQEHPRSNDARQGDVGMR